MRCTFQLRVLWFFQLMEGRCKRKNSVSDDRHAARPAAILWVDLMMMGKIEFGKAEAKWRKESAWRDGWRGVTRPPRYAPKAQGRRGTAVSGGNAGSWLSRASSVLCLLSCLSTIRCHPPKVGKVYIPSLSHVAHFDIHQLVLHRSSSANTDYLSCRIPTCTYPIR